jgi:hypothetical protein
VLVGTSTWHFERLKLDPVWDSLGKDPQFQKLIDGDQSAAATP